MLYLYVAVGGAFGSLCRFMMMEWLGGREFPYATLIINVLGSFLLGATIAFLAPMMPRGRELHALIAIGALGGFTTFSTFAMDSYLLIEKGMLVQAASYIAGSVILSIASFFAGMWVLRAVAV